MNEDKELEEAKFELLWFAHIDILYGNTYCMDIQQLNKIQKAIETVLQALEKLQKHCKEMIKEKRELTSALLDSIPKEKIEEYLAEETEKYKVYKKEVDKNENLRRQLWHHMGAKNMCEKILGIEKTVTLD